MKLVQMVTIPQRTIWDVARIIRLAGVCASLPAVWGTAYWETWSEVMYPSGKKFNYNFSNN